jgi:CheY-like chemotaxis protein
VQKRNLLLVDADPRALALTEANLKRAGFNVVTAGNGREALEKCEASPPDLVISETKLPEMDGFDLCQQLKSDERFKRTPFIFLTGQKSLEYKVTGLELGVEDYLTKPIYFKEIVTRVNILFQRGEREFLDRKEGKGSFTGNLADMGLVDLIQTLEKGRKSGELRIQGPGGRPASIYVSDGNVIDCEVGKLVGEDAFVKILTWQEGEFGIAFKAIQRQRRITISTQNLLLESLYRIDECPRVLEQLPAPSEVPSVDHARLAAAPDLTGTAQEVLRLIDGRRTLGQVLEAVDSDDLTAAQAMVQLFRSGVIRTGPKPEVPPPARAPSNSESRTPPPQAVSWFLDPRRASDGPAHPVR